MADDVAFTQVLREPILDIAGEPVTELTFRKPRGGDIIKCGNPVRFTPFGDASDISFDETKLGRMLSALSGIPLPMIERMDPNDLMECAWGIAGFFIPGLRSKPKTT